MRWSGQELAERLEVSARTVRYDVDKLRQLGYPVHGGPGVGGGYELCAGTTLPPLLLDEEAVAIDAALTKLDHLFPARLRRRVAALRQYTASVAQADDRSSTPTGRVPHRGRP